MVRSRGESRAMFVGENPGPCSWRIREGVAGREVVVRREGLVVALEVGAVVVHRGGCYRPGWAGRAGEGVRGGAAVARGRER